MLQIQCFLLRSTFYKYFSKVDLKAYCTFCFWASWNLLGQVDIWYHLPDEQVVEFLLIKNVEFAISTPVDPSLKNFDDIIIACDLQIGTPNQKSWLRLCQIWRNFYVWLFSFSTHQKAMLCLSRGLDIFEDLYCSRPRTWALRAWPRTWASRPSQDVLEDSTSKKTQNTESCF